MSWNIRAQDLKVTLLGTGSPIPVIDRFGPSTLVEAGPEKLLIDCGRGASLRLWQRHVPLGAVTAVFLTHLHSDHVVGIPDLWLTGWLPPPFGHRTGAFQIWGPTGTKELMANLQKAFAADIQFRIADGIPQLGIAILAHDITQGLVYEKNGVKVTAFEVDHATAKPAFGYRIDYGGHSVVLSGDTRLSEPITFRFSGLQFHKEE
jgi:ribonuclease Z